MTIWTSNMSQNTTILLIYVFLEISISQRRKCVEWSGTNMKPSSLTAAHAFHWRWRPQQPHAALPTAAPHSFQLYGLMSFQHIIQWAVLWLHQYLDINLRKEVSTSWPINSLFQASKIELYERNNQERKLNGNIVKLKICNLKKKEKQGFFKTTFIDRSYCKRGTNIGSCASQ